MVLYLELVKVYQITQVLQQNSAPPVSPARLATVRARRAAVSPCSLFWTGCPSVMLKLC